MGMNISGMPTAGMLKAHVWTGAEPPMSGIYLYIPPKSTDFSSAQHFVTRDSW